MGFQGCFQGSWGFFRAFRVLGLAKTLSHPKSHKSLTGPARLTLHRGQLRAQLGYLPAALQGQEGIEGSEALNPKP